MAVALPRPLRRFLMLDMPDPIRDPAAFHAWVEENLGEEYKRDPEAYRRKSYRRGRAGLRLQALAVTAVTALLIRSLWYIPISAHPWLGCAMVIFLVLQAWALGISHTRLEASQEASRERDLLIELLDRAHREKLALVAGIEALGGDAAEVVFKQRPRGRGAKGST